MQVFLFRTVIAGRNTKFFQVPDFVLNEQFPAICFCEFADLSERQVFGMSNLQKCFIVFRRNCKQQFVFTTFAHKERFLRNMQQLTQHLCIRVIGQILNLVSQSV